MAARLNISISDELNDDLKSLKSQIPEKVSVICQDALSRTVQRIKNKKMLQEASKQDPEIIKTIKRLKGERTELEKKIERLGRKDGLEWAQKASYVELYSLYGKDDKKIGGSRATVQIAKFVEGKLEKKEVESVVKNVEELDVIFNFDPLFDEMGQEIRDNLISYYIRTRLSIEVVGGELAKINKEKYLGYFIESSNDFWEVVKEHVFEETDDKGEQ